MTPLSRPEQAAALVLQLRLERAAALLRRLSDDETIAIAEVVAQLPELERNQLLEAAADLGVELEATSGVVQGGPGAARLYTGRDPAPLGADHRPSEEARAALGPAAVVAARRPVDVDALADVLQNEAPQVVAAVFVRLDPTVAAAVLERLPSERRGEIALRHARLGRIDPDTLDALVAGVASQAGATTSLHGDTAPVDALVAMLSAADGDVTRSIIEALSESDPELAEALLARLFTFEDLLALDSRQLSEVLRFCDQGEVALAMKGLTEEDQARLLGALSSRAQEIVLDEMELQGPQPLSKVMAARNALLRAARELDRSGEITLAPGEELV